MTEDRRRLFFALWPDAATRDRLARIARGVALHPSARPVPPDKLHVTLSFLGDTPPGRQACYEQAAAGLAGEPFTLTLDRFGHFPRPRVFWLGPSAVPAPLAAFVEGLTAALQACGFEPERRPFHPHVTLARKVRRRPAVDPVRLDWNCEDFCLVESAAGVYRALKRWPLGDISRG